ncbi:hypothetical protein [Pseudomonas huanghezhanensis]|uniref:hypothetical protein n=1 Tax=Pseudomonas huanghezhanensis TaxID=3002903 RepID=UPI00228602BB|nr:hypothetical protein [Pseudomonas sp. BSw22131]
MSSYDGKANVTFSGVNLTDGDIQLRDVSVKYDLQGWDFDSSTVVRTRVGGTLYVEIGDQIRAQHADSAAVELLEGADAGLTRNFSLGSNIHSRNVRNVSDGWLEIHIR